MASLESIKEIIKNLHKYKYLESQANARYILYGVHENKEAFPRFDIHLTEKTEYLAYLYLEAACSLFEDEVVANAAHYFEKGASLLEYNHAASRDNNISDFSLMVSSLAYYCASQYSKSFIVISKGQYNTIFTEIIKNFLTKRFDLLEDSIKESHLSHSDSEDWDGVYKILLARAMSLVVCYFNYGKEEYLQQATQIVNDARELASMNDDPAIWWEFRLLHIIISHINKSSLWGCLHNNPLFKIDDCGENDVMNLFSDSFDITNHDYANWDKKARNMIDKYIYSLIYREKPITELFISQREALEKALMNESSVVSMPTSSGKTRIAEIVMLQSLLRHSNAKVLYIAPYRSLAYELEETFTTAFSSLDFEVSHLYGGAQFTALDKAEMMDARILIVTPEKAKAILRSNDEIVESIKLVVMDEGHILGTGEREMTNEMFTEELRRIVRSNTGRFLVLSAVLPNAQQMSIWLADKEDRVVKNDWKPSDQRIGLLCYYPGRVDLEWQGDFKSFNNTFVVHEGDKKIAVAKTAIKLSGLGSVLIYCPQNRQVMTNANTMYSLISEDENIDWGNDTDWVKFSLICQETNEGMHYLELAQKGILCHSGSLDQDIRRYMEKLLRKGKAKYIYATNTLAQGVNLGVSTIIINGVNQRERRTLPKSDFWNMAGRAGRAFVDTEGKILFVCDCSNNEKWHRDNAHKYIDQLQINEAISGVYKCLDVICQIQNSSGIDINTYIQLITENKIDELSNDRDARIFLSHFFELIDDSLLALDLFNRDSEDDDAHWVDEHFRYSLAVIQQKDEELREKHIRILKARVKAVRTLTHGGIIPQSFASSGIPIKAALYLENKIDKIVELADKYLESTCNTRAMLSFFCGFDEIIENIDSIRIKVPEKSIRDAEMENWLTGAAISGKNGTTIRNYYSYTISWILNSIANRFASEDEEMYKNLFENMSLIASYGVPSKWAAQIYLCGIHSRLSATELSKHLYYDNELEKLVEVASFIKLHSDSILSDDNLSDLTKGWIRVLMTEEKSGARKIPKLKNISILNEITEMPDILFCKKFNDGYYLCSGDMKYIRRVADSENDRFSEIADIPGIYFQKENNKWKMQNVNPFVVIE